MENLDYRLHFRKLEKRFDELWGMKAHVRESVHDWLTASNVSSRISEVCANACSELLENCIKYASNGSVITVVVSLAEQTIVVETMNSAHNEHRASLRQALNALQASSEPKQLFVHNLLYPVGGESHIGLIRLILETRGTLELVPEEDQELVHLQLRVKRK